MVADMIEEYEKALENPVESNTTVETPPKVKGSSK